MGRAFFQIIAVIAELERELIRERTSEAMRHHMANGRKMGGTPPFGWQFEGDRMIVFTMGAGPTPTSPASWWMTRTGP